MLIKDSFELKASNVINSDDSEEETVRLVAGVGTFDWI